MSRKHYHVLFGLRGCYMPDLNFIASSRREAIKLARQEATVQNAHYVDDAWHKRLIRTSTGNYENSLYAIEITPACYDMECMCDA